MNTQSTKARRVSVVLAATLLLGGATACGDSSPKADAVAPAPAAPPAPAQAALTTLVGDLSASTTKLGLIVEGDKVWGYLCDPNAAAVGVTGTVIDGVVNLTEPDGLTTVTGTYADGAFTGKVNLNGTTSHDVTAALATGQAGVFALYKVNDNSTELGVWIRDVAGKAVGNVTTISNDPTESGDITQGTSDVPAEVVPFGLVDRARCFLASRRLVKAMQQGGSAAKAEAALNYARACNAAFPSVD